MHLATTSASSTPVETLAERFREVADGHADEADVFHLCRGSRAQCDGHRTQLAPFVERYGEDGRDEPERLHSELFHGTRTGGLGLLRDLQDLYLMAAECDIAWTLVGQAAQGVRDEELLDVVSRCEEETVQLLAATRMKEAAPQALVVAD